MALTTGQVAKICRVSSRTAGSWFDRGLLNGYLIPGSKDRRVPIEELAAFMEKHNMPQWWLREFELETKAKKAAKQTA